MTTAGKFRRNGLRRLFSRRILALLPALLGLAVLVFLVRTRTGSPRYPASEVAQAVRVVSAPEADVVPRT